ncbi:MAG: hypothetical protein ACXWQO_11515 [Bdellovibrionota bacterium]
MKKVILFVCMISTVSVAAQAATLSARARYFSGTEILADGAGRNAIALILENGEVNLHEQIADPRKLKIVDSRDGRGLDGDLTVTFDNGDKLIATAGFGSPVEYTLIHHGQKTKLVPQVELELK